MKNKLIEYRNSHKEDRTLINTVIGELDRISKTPSDEQVIQVIKKMIESNELTNSTEENEVLIQFIPKQLSQDEIISIIKDNDLSVIKDRMTFFKKNYSGLYDGKLVSSIKV